MLLLLLLLLLLGCCFLLSRLPPAAAPAKKQPSQTSAAAALLSVSPTTSSTASVAAKTPLGLAGPPISQIQKYGCGTCNRPSGCKKCCPEKHLLSIQADEQKSQAAKKQKKQSDEKGVNGQSRYDALDQLALHSATQEDLQPKDLQPE